MSNRIYLYPRAIRLWHFVNAILILTLIFTGVSIQYTDPAYPFMRFDLAISIHNYCGVILSINYLLFFFANIVTKNIKHYYFSLKGYIGDLMKQARYYSLGIFRGENPPFPITETRKFNPLQQFSYVVIMYLMVPMLMATGFGLLYPELVPARIFWVGGIFMIDLFHIIGAFIVSVFLFIHVYFCTIGKYPFRNFKSIISGYHEDNH